MHSLQIRDQECQMMDVLVCDVAEQDKQDELNGFALRNDQIGADAACGERA